MCSNEGLAVLVIASHNCSTLILLLFKNLVERQKALEADRQKQSAEREAELTKQYAEEKERALQENIRQMEESNSKQLKEMQEHYDKVMTDRMGEQKRLLEEGFQREADRLRSEINDLKNASRPKKTRCVIM